MASTSALLKSAAATKAKIQNQQDALVAFEWQNSAQTYDDYLAYISYLDSAASKTSDPSQALSYNTKIRSALSSYTSNEIQRQTQAVIEGRSTLQDKMQVVSQLYDQAVASGDQNLAQNLVTTWDSLSVQLQNEAKAAAGSAAQATTDYKNTVNDMIDQYKGVLQVVTSAYQTSSNNADWQASLQKINQQLPDNLKLPEGTGFFDIAASIVNSIGGAGADGQPDPNSILGQAIALAPDAKTANDLTKTYNKFAKGTVLELPGANGSNLNLSMDDLKRQIAAAQVGETIYQPETTANGTAWVKNKVDNYVFSRDAAGNYVAQPTYSLGGKDLGATILDSATGKEIKVGGKSVNYTDLLKQAGFDVNGEGGSFTINDPTGQNRLAGSNTVQAFIDDNGQLQFANNNNQIYQFSFDTAGNLTNIGETTPNPLNAVNGTDARFNNPYFANLPEDEKSVIQKAIDTGAIAILDQNLAKSQELNGGIPLGHQGITSLPHFSAANSASSVLQGAPITTQNAAGNLQAPQIISAPVAQIQAPVLNPANISSKANISLAPQVAPAATISTKPVNTNPTLTVQKKANTGNISF